MNSQQANQESSNPGHQTNAMVTTTYNVLPQHNNADRIGWIHRFPTGSILGAIAGSSFGDSDNVAGMYRQPAQAINTGAIMFNLPHINSILAQTFFNYLLEESNKPDQNIGTPDGDNFEIDYEKVINKGMQIGDAWHVAGFNMTPPPALVDSRKLQQGRNIEVLTRGTKYVDNVWGTHITQGDWCHIVLKLVRIDRLGFMYDLGEGIITEKLRVPDKFTGGEHYIPQFVAATSKAGCLFDEAGFRVHGKWYPGIEYLMGRCVFVPYSTQMNKRMTMRGSKENTAGDMQIREMKAIAARGQIEMYCFVT